MREQWRDVSWGWFAVSNLGRVYEYPRYVRHGRRWRLREGGMYPQQASAGQYPRLTMPGQVSVPTHRVIAELFLGGPEKETVNHKNGIKTDNRAENLEWATQRENNAHAVKTGLSKQRVKPVKRLSDGMTFDSLHEAAAYCNRAVGNLSSHLKGKQQTFAGDCWVYVEKA